MENKAKEYAQELVDMFRPYVDDYYSEHLVNEEIALKNAKHCALILISEMIKDFKDWESTSKKSLLNEMFNDRLDFLQSVKQEIEAL